MSIVKPNIYQDDTVTTLELGHFKIFQFKLSKESMTRVLNTDSNVLFSFNKLNDAIKFVSKRNK